MSTAAVDESTRGVVAELRWRVAPLTGAIAACAAVALIGAVALARPDLVAFAAPLLGVLVSAAWQRGSGAVRASAEPDTVRCFESEPMRIAVTAEPVSGGTRMRADLAPLPGVTVDLDETATDSGAAGFVADLTAPRWGNYAVTAQIEVTAPSGLLIGSARVPVAAALVYPLVSPRRTRMPETELPDRLGTHLTRRHGPGTEYAEIRVWAPGDQLRAVNWPVSARRGRLHVTERLTDRAADVVVAIDTYPQPTGPATEALDRAVRGAVQVVQTALQEGDRAGVVLLGQRPRWLGPDIGRRQFYRVLDAVLGAGDEHPVRGTLAPRFAVPPGAVVIAFSTMLDTAFALALIDLCRRGHTVVAVDVLAGSPFEHESDAMLAHLWRLERASMRRDFGVVGVQVVAWNGEVELDAVMRLASARTVRRRRR
ncbi:DUF58 domain-containing protein [Aldersonia sp. NBC_00410]|uniref:DUF58 domain-containing protein n=1 Tax=Aldersonia sp. NBC_00410 TaxID=2975954 RepID=UPI002258D1DC|nr:DUF58 domain-containing protein [Aldersonia sp. NBC_00410]MCX5043279.1 DUF58 domain-containing protein [Aldersonia sp. NBC_00410]